MEPNIENGVWKGIDFWRKEIKDAIKKEEYEKIPFFNDAVVEKRAPHKESGYGEPILRDIVIDGKKADIYHSDNVEGHTVHRLFIHLKE